jgi:phage terminase small subunit
MSNPLGRKRKPRQMKVLQGTVRKSRDREEPKFPIIRNAAPPKWLSNVDALNEWNRLVELLTPVYVLTSADLSMLGLLCVQFGEVLRKIQAQPPEQVSAAEYAQLRYYYTEFGLSPSSRSKVTPAVEAGPANPFSTLTGTS